MNSRPRKWVFFAAVALALGYCGPARAELVLELNTTGNPPLNTTERSGFLDRIAAEALRRVGGRLETIALPAERGLLEASQGFADGEISRIAGLEQHYPNIVPVPEKIMDWHFMAFGRGIAFLPDGWESLQHHSVAIINGWKVLEANIPQSADLLKAKTPEQLFSMLAAGRVDIVIFEKWGGLRQLRDQALQNVTMIEPPLISREMFIYLNKRHAALVEPLAQALRDMKNDGTYARLYDETISSGE